MKNTLHRFPLHYEDIKPKIAGRVVNAKIKSFPTATHKSFARGLAFAKQRVASVYKKTPRGFKISFHVTWIRLIIFLSIAWLAYPHSHKVVAKDNPSQSIVKLVGLPQTTLSPLSEASEIYLGNSYSWGNCTWFVSSQIVVPQNLGNANTWASTAASEGYSVSGTPKAGDVAASTSGWLGHVALVEAVEDGRVQVKEMNVIGLGVVDDAWYPTSYFQYITF